MPALPERKENDMLTLRLGQRHVETEHAQELIDAILRHDKSCDIVWFSTLYGYPPLSVHREETEKIKISAEMFRKAGIGVSMQIANTLGHGEYMKESDCSGLVYNDSPVEHMVGANGETAGYSFCWRGKHFRDYIEKTVKIYAEVKPDVIWIDDDIRADYHLPADYGCFCSDCISEFNKIYGSNFDRETLVHEINYGNIAWREHYINFCREGLADFVSFITRTVKEISPETKIGIQYAHHCNYMGNNDNYLLDAIKEAGGDVPQVRPGGGYYNDKSPLGQFSKTMRLACTNSLLPDYVKVKKAEIENIPDVVYGKSIGGTIIESTLHLASGCTGLTYATLMMDNELVPWHEKMLARFSEIRPYWEKLSDVSKNAYRSGLCIFKGEAAHLMPLSPDDEPFSWIDIIFENNIDLLTVGIPITHDQHKPTAYLLHHDMIAHLTDTDIEFLLSQPVLTDAESVVKLCKRGYSDRFRLRFSEVSCPAYERLTEHAINGEDSGRKFTESSFFLAPMQKYTIDAYDDTTEVIANLYHNITSEPLGNSAVLTHTYGKDSQRAAKWAVFGYCIWNDVISSAKRNQILNAIDWLSPLPSKLISCEQTVMIPSVDKNNKTVSVTVSSASIGETEELEILIRNPLGKKLTVMSTKHAAITPLSVFNDANELTVTLPSLEPYEIVTVFFEN